MLELHDQLMVRDEEVAILKQELQKNVTFGEVKKSVCKFEISFHIFRYHSEGYWLPLVDCFHS